MSAKIAGLNRLQARVPALRTSSGVARLIAASAAAIGVPTAFFVFFDSRFPRWMPDGEIVLRALGFLILSRFFSRREIFEQRYHEQAYAHAFANSAIPGLGIIFASIAHLAYIPGPPLPEIWWRALLVDLGWISLIEGSLLALRAFRTLGLDNLAMLYVYLPDERRVVERGVYGVMRHPTYGAVLRIGAGLALIHANWYALLVALILPLFFTGWITLFEEKELMRHVPAYAQYRRRLPAFWPRPRDIPKFWRLLFA